MSTARTEAVTCFGLCSPPIRGHAPMKENQKAFFSNERTYLHWLKMAVFLTITGLVLLQYIL